MKVTHPGFSKAAVIDTAKKYGEKGQYQLFSASGKGLGNILNNARKKNFEIRHDYDLIKVMGKKLPFRFIITDIPPRHVQPFHTHKALHELTIVLSGEIFYIESDRLSEKTSVKSEIKKNGVKLTEGDLVIDDKIKRHTVANFSRKYARMITIQSAKKEGANLLTDWIHS